MQKSEHGNISRLNMAIEEHCSFCLIFSRTIWENIDDDRYYFTKEELDEAEKKDEKLIGIRNNVRCYLPKIFDNE